MSFQDEYRELMAKPIDEIREDIFFRADNFRDEPWYDCRTANYLSKKRQII